MAPELLTAGNIDTGLTITPGAVVIVAAPEGWESKLNTLINVKAVRLDAHHIAVQVIA